MFASRTLLDGYGKKLQTKKKKNTASTEIRNHPPPGKKEWKISWVKLLDLLGSPCYYPSLLPALRQSRKLLASGDFSCSCFGVYPDVFLNIESSLVFLDPHVINVQKAIITVLKKESSLQLRLLYHSTRRLKVFYAFQL